MVKIVGKINLDNLHQHHREGKKNTEDASEYVRNTNEIISDIESVMSHNVNLVAERMHSFEGAPDNLISSRGSININSFDAVYGGEDIDSDKHLTHENKKSFYNVFDPRVQERCGISDPDTLLEFLQHNQKEKMRDGNISEDLLFLMMNKVAGDRYITLKTSEYDDFENGVDMVLVDTQTDAVICTFDATVSDVKSRMHHKIDRAKDRIKKGKGLRMKYGVSFDEDQKMKLGAIKNIPPLFLDLSKTDLKRILRVMDFRIDSELSDIEIQVASNLLDKMDDQVDMLDAVSAETISYDSSREFIQHVRETLLNLQKPE